jgi:hypothetical protein
MTYRTQSQLRELSTKRDLSSEPFAHWSDQCPKESSVRRRNGALTRGHLLKAGGRSV